MTFLSKILETKREEVAVLHRENIDISARQTPVASLRAALTSRPTLGLISEIKRKSPSKGVIQSDVDPLARARVYEFAGASGISVLTDSTYFGGSMADLIAVRKEVQIPVLRKDFIIDERQIEEAYAGGADAILLIAAALEANRLVELSTFAQQLGVEVLLEVHHPDELDAALRANPSVLGVNNRDLHTFEVDLATTETILGLVPSELVVISESGITGPQDAARMAEHGARGILVGEQLMRYRDLDDVSNCVKSLCVPLPTRVKR